MEYVRDNDIEELVTFKDDLFRFFKNVSWKNFIHFQPNKVILV
jgi:hypothetical protein